MTILSKSMKKIILLTMMLTLVLSLANCGARKKGSSAGGDTKESITVKGSDTMVILGQRWAEVYMKGNKKASVQVTGGGSGVGIAALINGSTDLANASRKMKDKEKKKLEAHGVKEIVTAKDGLTVYLHKDNPVTELSFNQLKQMYTLKITNWKEVGGPDAKIVLYGRDNSSGTYAYFKKHVLNKEDFAQETQTLPGTSAIVNAISKDINGVGYGGKAYAEGVKAVKIKKGDSDEACLPTEENVATGKYPLARPLHIYTTEKILKAKPHIQKYIDWILTQKGQSIVKDVGYYPINK